MNMHKEKEVLYNNYTINVHFVRYFLYMYCEAGVYDVICFPELPHVPTPIFKVKKMVIIKIEIILRDEAKVYKIVFKKLFFKETFYGKN